LQKLVYCSQTKSLFFSFVLLHFYFILFYYTFETTSLASFHAFQLNHNTRFFKLQTLQHIMACGKHTMWFHTFIIFSNLLKYILFCSLKKASTHVYKIINENWIFHVKNNIFLNISKDNVFSFTKFCSLQITTTQIKDVKLLF